MNYTKEEVDSLVGNVLENPDDRFVRTVYVDCLIAMAKYLSVETLFKAERDAYIENGKISRLGEWDARAYLSKCQASYFDGQDELNVVGEVIEKAFSEQK